MNFSLEITESSGKISMISFGKAENKSKKKTPLEIECAMQLQEYLSGNRKTFKVPLMIGGTDFQKKVWKEMLKIPYGKTLTYKELAVKIAKPNAYRAVANACGANNLPIIIPCHRVVASNGLGGYSAGIDIKKRLLELEKKNK
jgi:O-6-methylguanine DNA methyltransferase